MIALLIDTCTSNLIIAVYKDNKIIDKIIKKNDKELSTNFTDLVRKLLDNCKLTVDCIDRIYVSIGPGSFTGIRIGLTFAKVLAAFLEKELIPISSLQVLASGTTSEIIVPILNARRGYVFAGIYNRNLETIMEDKYISLEELNMITANYSNVTYVSCDDFDFDINKPNYDIEQVIDKNISTKAVNPHTIVPCYLKKTEAEEKKELNND